MKNIKRFNESIFDDAYIEEERQEQLKREQSKEKIIQLTNYIKYLKTTGDDSEIKQKISNAKYTITKLKDSLLTYSEKKKKEERNIKASNQRFQKTITQDKIQSKIEKRFNNLLSDRDIAINKLIDLNSQYNEIKKYPNAKKKLSNIIDTINNIKQQYNIKSKELKRKKLLKLETSILLNITTEEEARSKYTELLNTLQNKNTSNKDKNTIRKQLSDIRKFYGNIF